MPRDTGVGVSRRAFLAGASGSFCAALAGCTRAEGSDEPDRSGRGRSIQISGSSTVYPVTTAMQELFNRERSDVDISISRDGTSAGFENSFIPGNSDINNASRPITAEEREQCLENGFEPLEFLVARDALTVVVNNENDWVECMDLDTLGEIWAPNGPDTWADVNDDWPDEPLDLYGSATTSGTFDYFTEQVVGEVGEIRSDFRGTEEDDLIARGVHGSRYAMGYLPFAYYTNNPEETTALALDEGDGCVHPTIENARTGEYGLARPLFIYVRDDSLAEKPHVREFVEFYLRTTLDETLLADRIGYVPNDESRVEESLARIEEVVNE